MKKSSLATALLLAVSTPASAQVQNSQAPEKLEAGVFCGLNQHKMPVVVRITGDGKRELLHLAQDKPTTRKDNEKRPIFMLEAAEDLYGELGFGRENCSVTTVFNEGLFIATRNDQAATSGNTLGENAAALRPKL